MHMLCLTILATHTHLILIPVRISPKLTDLSPQNHILATASLLFLVMVLLHERHISIGTYVRGFRLNAGQLSDSMCCQKRVGSESLFLGVPDTLITGIFLTIVLNSMRLDRSLRLVHKFMFKPPDNHWHGRDIQSAMFLRIIEIINNAAEALQLPLSLHEGSVCPSGCSA